MGARGFILTLLIAAGLSLMALGGCGGGSSTGSGGDSSSADATSASDATSTSEDGATAKDFIVPGGENEAAEFGKEATDSEREAASVVLEENLEARASRDWTAQCASLSALGVKSIEEGPTSKGKTCAQVLAVEGTKAPKSVLENTLEGEIDVLRVQGKRAVALWHGKGGVDYSMAMENENGVWKVATLISVPLPKAEPKPNGEPNSAGEPNPEPIPVPEVPSSSG